MPAELSRRRQRAAAAVVARIGDVGAAPSKVSVAPRPSLAERLATPTAIAVVVPLLVAACGLAIGWAALSALRATTLAAAREHVAEQSRQGTAPIQDALARGDALLARLRPIAAAHTPSAPFDEVALALYDVVAVRPGVTYASLSFPDGTFQGAYRDTDGIWRFQDSRVAGDGTHVRRYDYDGRRIVFLREEHTAYDPRTRDFYRDALAHGGATWTEPYTFFGSHATGLTRTEPVMVDGALHAVTTVDYDVTALSSTLRERTEEGTRALLFASDTSVLAHLRRGRARCRGREREPQPARRRPARSGARCVLRCCAA